LNPARARAKAVYILGGWLGPKLDEIAIQLLKNGTAALCVDGHTWKKTEERYRLGKEKAMFKKPRYFNILLTGFC
jgi:hypothetical protein